MKLLINPRIPFKFFMKQFLRFWMSKVATYILFYEIHYFYLKMLLISICPLVKLLNWFLKYLFVCFIIKIESEPIPVGSNYWKNNVLINFLPLEQILETFKGCKDWSRLLVAKTSVHGEIIPFYVPVVRQDTVVSREPAEGGCSPHGSQWDSRTWRV